MTPMPVSDYNIFVARSKQPYHVDPRIKNLVNLINTYEGIRTVWSCSAHTLEEYQKEIDQDTSDCKFDIESFHTDSMYIVFVVREEVNEIGRLHRVLRGWEDEFHYLSPNHQYLNIVIEDTSLLWKGIVCDKEGSYEGIRISIRISNNDNDHAALLMMMHNLEHRLRADLDI